MCTRGPRLAKHLLPLKSLLPALGEQHQQLCAEHGWPPHGEHYRHPAGQMRVCTPRFKGSIRHSTTHQALPRGAGAGEGVLGGQAAAVSWTAASRLGQAAGDEWAAAAKAAYER